MVHGVCAEQGFLPSAAQPMHSNLKMIKRSEHEFQSDEVQTVAVRAIERNLAGPAYFG